MGFKGLTYDYNRYLMTAKPQYQLNFEQHHFELNIALENIARRHKLTSQQSALVATIKRSTDTYYQHLLQASKDLQQPAPMSSLAKQYTAMHQALQQLQHQAPLISSKQWWAIASERINLLHQMNIQLTHKIARQSDVQKQLIVSSLYISLLSGILLFYMVFILGKYIANSLISSITTIVNDVEEMAKDPNLQLNIEIKGNDELTQISTALNQMLSERMLARTSLQQASAVFEHSSEGHYGHQCR